MTELSTNSGLQERRFQKSYTLKKFLSRSVFGELQLMQISLNYQTSYCSEIKITRMGTKYVWLFYCFYFERNYNVFKSKSLFFFCFFLIKFKKTRRYQMENRTHNFREMNEPCSFGFGFYLNVECIE